MKKGRDSHVEVVWSDPDYTFALENPCPRCGSFYGQLCSEVESDVDHPYACVLCGLVEAPDWKPLPKRT